MALLLRVGWSACWAGNGGAEGLHMQLNSHHYKPHHPMNDLFDICQSRHKGNPQSAEAHESIVTEKSRMHQAILAYLRHEGGCTCEQVEQGLGLSHQTASARMSELKARGLARDSGRRRPTSSGRMAAILEANV